MFSINAIAMVALFTISTFLWSSNIAVLVKRVNIVFVDREGNLLSRLQLANSSTELQRYMNDVIFTVAYLIGDALIVWRIIILYQRQRVIAFSMLLLWLGAATTGVGLFGCLVQAKFPESDALPRLCTNLENASWTISLILNAVGTALLARLAWKSSRLISENRYTKADRVLCTLVTAGLIYFILGLPRLTAFANQSLNPLPSNVSFATQVIAAMLDNIVGLYPTAVTAVLFYESKIFESQTRVPSNLPFWPESTIRVEVIQSAENPLAETEVAKPADDSDTWAVKAHS
ncbi:hypothetical protein EXIGLDRAFT_696317 [Exidia glandulosa HHB12029]|uniref:G-protein coupled receptors family 1 profile domain-containing protein n=1 Tax=Exidia glandulosa HHB12029 TaxID=1314781 RepID=A0A165FDC1_EXIGL|nr:hypothetical protein EXIGLDRAFT_696317 [Exidia glandulosa HHB12029]